MSSISILGYKLINNSLRLDVESNETSNRKVEVLLINRSTKKQKRITPNIDKSSHNNALVINFDKVVFDQVEKNVLDIYLEIDGIRRRVHYKNYNQKNKVNKYSSSMYKINNKRVAVPYITEKGNLSILYGNSSAVFATYCQSIKDKLTISNVKITQKKVRFRIDDLKIDDNFSYFVALYNRDQRKFTSIDYTFHANEPSVFEIDLSDMRNYELGSDFNLFLISKTNNTKKDYRLILDQNNNFEPFKVRRDKKVALYVDNKGLLSLRITNDNMLDEKKYNMNQSTLFIKEYHQENKILNVNIEDKTIIRDFDSYAITLVNIKSSQVVTLNRKEAIFYNKKQLQFHLEKMFSEGIFSNGQRWKVYLKIYKDDCIYLYEIKKDNEWVDTPINRHMKPVKGKSTKSVITYISGLNELAFLIGDEEIYHKEVYKKESGTTTIDNVQLSDQLLTFKIKDLNLKKIDNIRIIFRERKTKEIWWQDTTLEDSLGLVKLDLSDFINAFSNKVSRWDLFLEIKEQDIFEFNRIGCFNKPEMPAHQRFYKSIRIDSPNVVTPYLTIKNELSIVIRNELALFNEKLKSNMSITKFKMKKSIISGEVILELPECKNYEATELILKYRNKIENIEYKFNAKQNKINNKSKISFRIDLKSLELQNYFWDLFIVIKVDGEDYLQKLKSPVSKVKKAINKKVVRYSYTYNNGFFVYPYITSVNTLALGYKKKEIHEGLSYKIKENLAYYTYKLFKPYLDRKAIWLGFEKFSEGAQDNGYFFFKYCYENNKKKNFYYIMKKDSPDYSNLEGMEDKVIEYMSFRHMLYLYAAELLVSSESKGHSYDIRIEKGRLRRALKTKKHVFLQHGVIALKKVDHVFKKTGQNVVDLFVVSSDYEKNIIMNSFGYNDQEVIVTGLSRWDVLEDKSKDNKEKVIFVMPTWRTWMDDLPEEKFVKTNYYKNYTGLLTSPKLNTFLKEKGIQLQFYIHPKFKDYVDKFKTDNDNVKVYQYGEERVNELLMKSSMLITDYSSVAWEMFHMKKPIIFYQFDIDEYNMYQGSYLNMEKELFGDRTFNLDQLIDGIQEYADRNFVEKEKYGKYRSHYFKYVDKNNCKRTYNAIIKNSKKLKLRKERNFVQILKNNRFANSIKTIIRKNEILYNFALKTRK